MQKSQGILTRKQVLGINKKANEVVKRDAYRSLFLTQFGFSGMKEMFAYELSLLGVNSFAELPKIGIKFSDFREKCYEKYQLN